MLRSFRTAAHSWVAKLLFILLIASFGVWGVGDMVRRIGPGDELAKVGETDITRQAVDEEFRRLVERIRPMMGGNFTNEQAAQLGFAEQATQTLVQRTLLRLAAADAGLAVGDEQIRRRIAAEKAFQNAAGQFDPGQFQAVLRQNNLTEPGFVAMLRNDLARQALGEAVTGGIAPPQALLDALFAHRGERRAAETLTLPHAAMTDIPAADAATLQTYHAEHAVVFTAPEYRSLTVAQLLLDDLAKEVKLTEADIAAAYEERRADYETPERRTLRMAVLDDEAKAKALATAAQTAGLDAAAKTAGVDVVDLGEAIAADLPGFGDAVFAQPKGVGATPVRSALGWHVVETVAMTPGAVRPLAAVRDEVAKGLARERAADGVFQSSNRLDDQLAGGAPLEEVSRGLGLKLTKIAATDATGKGPDGQPALTGLTDGARIVDTAFTLAPNATSRLVESRSGDFFVVRVDGVTPPALRPFDAVKDEVAAAWKAEQQAIKAAEKAKGLAEQLQAAGSGGAAALAKAAGAEYALIPAFARDQANGAALPPDVVQKLFTLTPGQVAAGQTGAAQVLARLTEILPADPTAQAAEKEALKTSLAQAMESDVMAQFISALQQRWPVVMHHDRINRLYSQN